MKRFTKWYKNLRIYERVLYIILGISLSVIVIGGVKLVNDANNNPKELKYSKIYKLADKHQLNNAIIKVRVDDYIKESNDGELIVGWTIQGDNDNNLIFRTKSPRGIIYKKGDEVVLHVSQVDKLVKARKGNAYVITGDIISSTIYPKK
jgi:hypothetical protein